MAKFESLRIGPEKNFTYMILCPETGECGLIDPSFDFEKIAVWVRKQVPQKPIQVKFLIATHGHWDHAGGFNSMLEIFPNAKVLAHAYEKARLSQLAVKLDVPVDDGEIFKIGNIEVKAIHTPGHTEGGCCYLAHDQIFTGDTLFVGQCGRTDMTGGSDEALFKSLEKLKGLDETLVVRPGHDYGPTPTSTLAHEIETNPTMQASTVEEFIALP